MTVFLVALTRWAQSQRIVLRVILAIAGLSILIDGFVVDRSLVHMLLLHPMLLLILMFAAVLTEEIEQPGTNNGP